MPGIVHLTAAQEQDAKTLNGCRLTVAQTEMVKAVAREDGSTASAFIRGAIFTALRARGYEPTP